MSTESTETTAQGTTDATVTGGEGASTETTDTSTVLAGGEGEASTTDAETGETAGEASTTAGEEAGDSASQGDADGDGTGAEVPEKYEFTLPDNVPLDEALVAKVDPVFRELGLTNEQANKLANAFAEHRVSEAESQQAAYAKQVEDWGKQASEDAEFGGAGFEKNAELARAAIGRYGTPELKALLADGLGNHPELIRFCVRVGKAMSEDGGVDGGTRTPGPKSLAERMYPNQS